MTRPRPRETPIPPRILAGMLGPDSVGTRGPPKKKSHSILDINKILILKTGRGALHPFFTAQKLSTEYSAQLGSPHNRKWAETFVLLMCDFLCFLGIFRSQPQLCFKFSVSLVCLRTEPPQRAMPMSPLQQAKRALVSLLLLLASGYQIAILTKAGRKRTQ